MRKYFISGLALFIILGSAFIYFYGQPSRSIDSDELSVVQKELSLYTDKIDLLDMQIAILIRSEDAADISMLDSLKKAQSSLWSEYADLRAQLAVDHEGSSPGLFPIVLNPIQSFIRKIGVVYFFLGAFLVCALLYIFFYAKKLLRQAPPESLVPTPKDFKRRISLKSVSQNYKPTMEDQFKDTVRSLAEITENQILSTRVPSEENVDIPSIITEPAQHQQRVSSLEEHDESIGFPIPEKEDNIEEIIIPVPHDEHHIPSPKFLPFDFQNDNIRTGDNVLSYNSLSFNPKAANSGLQSEPVVPVEAPQQVVSSSGDSPTQKWEIYRRENEKKSDVIRLARRGSTSSEISRRLKMSREEVELLIRAHNSQ
ncbi:MAG: hypothetical protein HQK83_13430 [Fibrobacteria bacterium]|nr:hypothetical protein [Fibrobacteria bacterium]